jgi:O-antigen/teichoic acid export membrane protein
MGAAAGAGLGVLQARIRPERLARAWTWWRQEGVRLGRWLGLENCLIAGQSQVLIIVLASLLGARDLGGLRAVESVFAPMTVVGEAIGMPGLPMLSRALADSWRAGRRVAVVLSSVTLATVAGYVLVAGLIRGPVLSTVFGPSFRHFANLVVPIAVGQVVYAWASGFWLLTKASGRGGVLLTARAVGSGGSLLLATVLGATFGLTGAAWGLTLGTGAGSSLITYFAFARRSVDVMPDPAEPAVVSDAALGAPTGLPDP